MTRKISTKLVATGLGMFAALGLVALSSGPAAAQAPTHNQTVLFAADGNVSATEAKRIVRRFLRSQGYTYPRRSMKSARIGQVTRDGRAWKVGVALYSGLKSERTSVYVNTATGLLTELRPSDAPALAEAEDTAASQ